MTLRIGKLDNEELEALVLSKFRNVRPESLFSPEIGRDCAALDLGGDLAVLSTDPITSAGAPHLGRLTVHVSCNDAAAAGADPVGLLVTLLVPPTFTKEQIGRIADDLASAARDAGVDILGGHTEVTDAVTRPITNAAVIARMPKSKCLPGMKPGDDLVLTKWAALEGTTILAEDYAPRLSGLDSGILSNAKAFTRYLSVVPESHIAMENGATDMHDVTEGGVLGAVWELCRVCGCGARVDTSAIPILPETAEICQALSLDPLRLIGSGSMLISCNNGRELVQALAQAGIHSSVIGKAFHGDILDEAGAPIAPPGADELYRAAELN